MQIDYLVVGQGLAGSILADHLMDRGFSIRIVSNPSLSNSSLVAGGLYNPVTGRKLVKTWNCDNLFSYLIPYYRNLERKLGAKFLNELTIYRPFSNIEAQNEWMGKSADGSYDEYVEEVHTSSKYNKFIKDEFGGVLLKKSGYVDTAILVRSFESYFKKQGVLFQEKVEHEDFKMDDTEVEYKGGTYKGVIFCEGQLARHNPLFSWLPFKPVKGELIYVKTEHQPKVIYNRGVFVISKKNGVCKVGATYNNQNLTNLPTEEGKNELNRKLKELIKFDYSIVDQKAGIRPATKDRRPLIGNHPKLKNVYIFNGLGAKGVSLAPFYANQLVSNLNGEIELDTEVNIERYFSLF